VNYLGGTVNAVRGQDGVWRPEDESQVAKLELDQVTAGLFAAVIANGGSMIIDQRDVEMARDFDLTCEWDQENRRTIVRAVRRNAPPRA